MNFYSPFPLRYGKYNPRVNPGESLQAYIDRVICGKVSMRGPCVWDIASFPPIPAYYEPSWVTASAWKDSIWKPNG